MRLRITNWRKYNPRPRNDVKSSSWFRMENTWIDDPNFYDLSAWQRLAWICVLSVASAKMSDEIAVNSSQIAARCAIRCGCGCTVSREDVVEVLNQFVQMGLIEILADGVAANPQQVRQESAADSPRGRPDEEAAAHPKPGATNGTGRNETGQNTYAGLPPPATSKEPEAPDLVELWNKECGPLPKVTKLTDKRRKAASVRLREQPNLGYWRDVVRRMTRSRFCRGESARRDGSTSWRATFDWLVGNDSNHVKVSEGSYDDRPASEVVNTSNSRPIATEDDYA